MGHSFVKTYILVPNIRSHLFFCSKSILTKAHTICSTNNRALQKVHLQVGQMIAQEVDLVEIFSLLLRANLPNVPKIHLQIFINPMTTNVIAIHRKL